MDWSMFEWLILLHFVFGCVPEYVSLVVYLGEYLRAGRRM